MTRTLSGAAPAVAFVTLGCAKNEVDTAHMGERLTAAGFRVVPDPEVADAIVVNTCSFIQSATEESLEAIFEAAGLPNVADGAPLVVAGCMPARYGDDLAVELTEATAFVPCSREDDIVEVLAEALGLDDAALAALAAAQQDAVETGEADEVAAEGAVEGDVERAVEGAAPLNDGAFEDGLALADSAVPVFAYVKISDGCDRFCSYCTIPYIRGRYHSFPYEAVRAEVSARVGQGAREIVLIAQDTGRWGADFDEPSSLACLVSALADEFPDTWFRIMYIQPEGVTDALLDAVVSHANVCPYFDIPLQHVNPTILRAMNRTGSRAEFEALVARIRERVPGATLRTTLIAGFPGETDEDFDELCDFVEEGLFDYVGVFPYSREEGTRAYDLPDQVDEDEKAHRAQLLRDVADATSAPRIAERVGLEMDVLVEGFEDDGQRYGRAMCQAPEVDGVTYVDAGEPGQVVRVRIVDTLLYEMEGE